MKKLIQAVGVFLLILSAFGCATYGGGLDPSNFSSSNKTRNINLTSDQKWNYTNIFGDSSDFTLKEGVYKPYLDSDEGTYYEGVGQCINIDYSFTESWAVKCGLYLPNNKSGSIIVYYYLQPGGNVNSCRKNMKSQHGALIGALAAAECDNIRYFKEQPSTDELKSRITFID